MRWIVRDLHVKGELKGNEAIRRVLARGEGEVKVGEAGMMGRGEWRVPASAWMRCHAVGCPSGLGK